MKNSVKRSLLLQFASYWNYGDQVKRFVALYVIPEVDPKIPLPLHAALFGL
jgi:hypothetical protein